MGWIGSSLLYVSKILYPNGRAFKMPVDGALEALHNALGESEAQAWNDAESTLDSLFPDSPGFTIQDAEIWEQRLGITVGAGTTFDQRKAAILQKMAYPGTAAPRCAASYVQAQLQLAGFEVGVYRNRFFVGGRWISKPPGEVESIVVGNAYYGEFNYGEADYNGTWADGGVSVVANYIDEVKDALFSFLEDYDSTFYIAGLDGLFVDLPAVRKMEFRQLLLTLKPENTVGILFVNFV